MSVKEETFLPFPVERARVPVATSFRSTWLTSSLASLRERGHYDAYLKEIDPAWRDTVLSAVPGVWLPMGAAMAHYGACDRLEMPHDEMVAMGECATRRANATSFAYTARLATGAGVTPWTIFSQANRLWAHTCQGGGIGIFKHGPKEARIEIVGLPLARYRYNRVTMRGIIQAAAQLFSRKVYAVDLPRQCGPNELVMRVSWV